MFFFVIRHNAGLKYGLLHLLVEGNICRQEPRWQDMCSLFMLSYFQATINTTCMLLLA